MEPPTAHSGMDNNIISNHGARRGEPTFNHRRFSGADKAPVDVASTGSAIILYGMFTSTTLRYLGWTGIGENASWMINE